MNGRRIRDGVMVYKWWFGYEWSGLVILRI